MKYKAGDKVRITKQKSGRFWNSGNKMDRWLGKEMTIKEVSSSTSAYVDKYIMIEDDGRWSWFDWMIEGLADNSKNKKKGSKMEVIYPREFEVRTENQRVQVSFCESYNVSIVGKSSFNTIEEFKEYISLLNKAHQILKEKRDGVKNVEKNGKKRGRPRKK